jgi:tRNA dimethylallyltransferase
MVTKPDSAASWASSSSCSVGAEYAVTEGWTPPEVMADERLRDELGRLASRDENSAEWLHDRLNMLDPDAAAKIDARNVRRTIRALEVILTTGKKFSEQRGQVESPYQLIAIGLTRPREELYRRVDQRIEAMFAHGFVDEVKGLLGKGYSPTLPGMSAIGYRECVSVAKGELTEEQAKAEMRRVTRIFVRRQANWFKESDARIKWFHPNQEKALEQIERYIYSCTGSKNPLLKDVV